MPARRSIHDQVTTLVYTSYQGKLLRVLAQTFPRRMQVYHEALIAEGPNIVTRSIHKWSVDVTIHIYTFSPEGPYRFIITNPRLRSLGGESGSGAPGGPRKKAGRTKAPRGRSFRALPVGPEPRRKQPKNPNQDVSGYIDKGYNRSGPRKAEAFQTRRIGDSYHEHSWRVSLPEQRTIIIDATSRWVING